MPYCPCSDRTPGGIDAPDGKTGAPLANTDPGARTCAVVLAVTTHELVTVAVDTCDIAKKAATAIAGRIPR